VKLKWSALFSTCGTSWPCAFIYSQRVIYLSLVHAWIAFEHRRMICEIIVVCSLFHLWYFLTMCVHLFSECKLHFTCSFIVSILQDTRTICEIKVVCSLFHLWYILTMCIHLFSGGKLLFTGSFIISTPKHDNDLWNQSGLLFFPLPVHPDHVHSFILRW